AALRAALGGDLLVGQDGAQSGAPVDLGVRQVHQPVRVQDPLLLDPAQVGPGTPEELGGQRPRTLLEQGAQLGDGSRPAGAALVVVTAVAGAGRGVGVIPGTVDLEEDPLGPAVEPGVGGGDDAARVVAQPQSAELALHGGDVRLGGHARVLT